MGGRGIPLSHEEDFAFSDLKFSDLVHTFGEIFVCFFFKKPIENEIFTIYY